MGTTIKKPMKIPLNISDVLDPFWDPSSAQMTKEGRNYLTFNVFVKLNMESRKRGLPYRRTHSAFC